MTCAKSPDAVLYTSPKHEVAPDTTLSPDMYRMYRTDNIFVLVQHLGHFPRRIYRSVQQPQDTILNEWGSTFSRSYTKIVVSPNLYLKILETLLDMESSITTMSLSLPQARLLAEVKEIEKLEKPQRLILFVRMELHVRLSSETNAPQQHQAILIASVMGEDRKQCLTLSEELCTFPAVNSGLCRRIFLSGTSRSIDWI